MNSVIAVAVDYIKNYQLLAIPRQGFFFTASGCILLEIHKHIAYSKPNKTIARCQNAAWGDT